MADRGTDPELLQMRMRFAEAVKTARKEARLSQAALGARIGRSQRYVSDVEKGVRSLPFDKMSMILLALGHRLRIDIKISPLQKSSKPEKYS